MKKVFIIVLNYNGKRDTVECLHSLKRLKVAGFRLSTVVVDNHSTDGSVELIKSLTAGGLGELTLIENRENLGFAGGNNVGIRYALQKGADFVLLLNNDTVVDKNLVAKLLNSAQTHRLGGIFGPKIYFARGFEFHRGCYQPSDLGKVLWYAGGRIDWQNVLFSHRGVDEVDRGQYEETEETDFVSGCAMFVRKAVFQKTGLLDSKYFAYLEDADFCQRARKEGFGIFYVPPAFLWHKVARSSGGIGSSLQEYYITRNRLLFAWRYAPFRSKFAVFRESLKFLLRGGIKREAVLDFYLRRFGRRRRDEKKD